MENRLGDLWSIFDFVNPGLLGSGQGVLDASRSASRRSPHNPYGPLRALVRPYILRRLKTDKSVIADLPDKTEMKAFCHLTRKQAALYQQAVAELASELGQARGHRSARGVVLASLMRLKQICNHPSQWLGDGAWREADSGKLARLREIAEVIAAKQEKVLVFTQFREMTAPLAAFLDPSSAARAWCCTARRRSAEAPGARAAVPGRRAVPFFVLSLKAGGTGLNLTAAVARRALRSLVESGGRESGDRPRVPHRPDQERAGPQVRVPRDGRREDRRADRIQAPARRGSARRGRARSLLTEMSDDELLKLVALDLHTALEGMTDGVRRLLRAR